MSQRWCDLLFAHWPVPAAALRSRIPEELEIDTFDGTAWIAVVPFRMEAIRPRWLPAVPWLSRFPELNLRTYVQLDDRPGVFFFSLDASNPVAVAAARSLFLLPYFRARMTCEREGDAITYRSRRTHSGAPGADLDARYGPAGDVFHAAPGTLEHFLTERYCLYTERRQRRPQIRRSLPRRHPSLPVAAAAGSSDLRRELAAAVGRTRARGRADAAPPLRPEPRRPGVAAAPALIAAWHRVGRPRTSNGHRGADS